MADHIDGALRAAVEEELLERLADGESLVQICRDERMPNRSTVQRWQDDDDVFDAAVTRARESGMFVRAERAVEVAKTATDASLGRLAFDAERWYVGKLSNAFSDDKTRKHELSGPGGEPLVIQWQS
jgi:hypothetical protein